MRVLLVVLFVIAGIGCTGPCVEACERSGCFPGECDTRCQEAEDTGCEAELIAYYDCAMPENECQSVFAGECGDEGDAFLACLPEP